MKRRVRMDDDTQEPATANDASSDLHLTIK